MPTKAVEGGSLYHARCQELVSRAHDAISNEREPFMRHHGYTTSKIGIFVGKLFYLPSIKPNLLSDESDLLLLLLNSLPSFRALFLKVEIMIVRICAERAAAHGA